MTVHGFLLWHSLFYDFYYPVKLCPVNWSRTILIILMIKMIAQLMNSNNDNCDDEHLNNLFIILLDQEKSQVLFSGKSKDLEIESSTGKGLYHLLVCIYCYNGWFIEWALVASINNQQHLFQCLTAIKSNNRKTLGHKDYIHCCWCIVFINVSVGCFLKIY